MTSTAVGRDVSEPGCVWLVLSWILMSDHQSVLWQSTAFVFSKSYDLYWQSEEMSMTHVLCDDWYYSWKDSLIIVLSWQSTAFVGNQVLWLAIQQSELMSVTLAVWWPVLLCPWKLTARFASCLVCFLHRDDWLSWSKALMCLSW